VPGVEGLAASQIRDGDEAIAAVNQAQKLGWEGDNTSIALAYIGRTRSNIDQESIQQALAEFQQALRFDPKMKENACALDILAGTTERGLFAKVK
jgi:tetratricopeptide (TPR) repeat protein